MRTNVMSMQPLCVAELVERCAWCGCRIQPDMRVLIAGGRFADTLSQIETLRGHVVRVRTSHGDHAVSGVVPLANTPAHHAGYDLLFVLCGIECRDALDGAIGDDPMTLTVTSSSFPPTPLPSRRRPLS